MRKFFLTAFVLSVMLVLATSSFALEKTAVRMTDDNRAGGWSAVGTCSVKYYNFCTGWLWVWSGWGAGDVLGACFDTCCPTSEATTLVTSWHYIFSPGPSGYGFTGTIQVNAATTDCCPTGAPIAQQVWLPAASGWNAYQWASVVVPPKFIISTTWPGPTNNPTATATDHPAAGPTGPQACGYCYPLNRATHTFYYGPNGTYCPGAGLNDGICNAELVWDVELYCTNVISVEESSWGSIKNLYR